MTFVMLCTVFLIIWANFGDKSTPGYKGFPLVDISKMFSFASDTTSIMLSASACSIELNCCVSELYPTERAAIGASC